MFGLTTKKKYNKLKKDFDEIFIKYFGESLKFIATEIFFEKINKELKSFKSKEFRKQELERYFEECRKQKINSSGELFEEYKSLFQKESCETKENLKKERKNNEVLNKIMDDINIKDKNQESLLKSVKEILDWYKSEELQFTSESKNDIKDMFLNLEIAYKNMTGTFGEHKSDSEEIIKEI